LTVVINEFNQDESSNTSKFLSSFKQTVDVTWRINRWEILWNKITSFSMSFYHQQSSLFITVTYLTDEFISTFDNQLISSFKFKFLVFDTWIFSVFIVHQIVKFIKSKQLCTYVKLRRSNDKFKHNWHAIRKFQTKMKKIDA